MKKLAFLPIACLFLLFMTVDVASEDLQYRVYLPVVHSEEDKNCITYTSGETLCAAIYGQSLVFTYRDESDNIRPYAPYKVKMWGFVDGSWYWFDRIEGRLDETGNESLQIKDHSFECIKVLVATEGIWIAIGHPNDCYLNYN